MEHATKDRAQCLLIGEVAQAHDGSISACHSYIDALADAGADAIKFQIHMASEESTTDDVFRRGVSSYYPNRYHYWKRMEFSREQWREISEHAKNRDLLFFASIFSRTALDLLIELDPPVIKIASGEIWNSELIEAVKNSHKPVFLSTGLSNWEEIDNIVKEFIASGTELTLMQCTSMYPTPLTKVGLNIVEEFKRRYQLAVGLSDHSGTIYPSLAAITNGVSAVELHVVFDKRMQGFDTTSSVTLDEFQIIAEYRDALETMTKFPVDKDNVASELVDVKTLFGRSIALKKDLEKGHILSNEDLCVKKPGGGIRYAEICQVIGKRLKNNVSHERLLRIEDLENG